MAPPQHLNVAPAEAGTSLVEWLARRLGTSRKQAKRLLDGRSVFVNRRRVWMAQHRLAAGDEVEVTAPPPRPVAPRLPAILYEDREMLVIDKPAGLTSNGPGSVEDLMRSAAGPLWAVHRLDRDTTGCNMFARSTDARERLVELFNERTVQKNYRLIAVGAVDPRIQVIENPVDGLSARTELRILGSNRLATYLEARIATGRTHQIRKHLRDIGHAIAGDRVYLTDRVDAPQLRGLPRQMLHAYALTWPDHASGKSVRVGAPLPADFTAALKRLGLGGAPKERPARDGRDEGSAARGR